MATKDTIAYEGIVYPKDGGSYDIPYRCLVPQVIENLLVGGKAISTDRDSYARFLQETMVTGQAAGVAAAICARRGHHSAATRVRTSPNCRTFSSNREPYCLGHMSK